MNNLPFEIIKAFETIKVNAPMFSDEVHDALVLVREKLAFYKTQGE